ncbi:MAG: carboxylating nicotinate-nucleotide diphosphorylase [Proteobacteria bacterium]|nr:carboxylating nicotinate-nucleotide diphosphorylase [Pseudomonadota bacterium]
MPHIEDQDGFDKAVRANVSAALAEDVGSGDLSAALIDPSTQARARVITRDQGVFCGQPWVIEVARQVDARLQITFRVADGDAIQPDQVLFEVEGPAASLLTAERNMLNFVQLLSGTATLTRHYVELLHGTATRLLDTRKTVPGLRAAQKYAVRCGGGHNHRMGLYDAYLIKENHITAAGSISAAVAAANHKSPDTKVEVEVETLAQLDEAIAAGVDIAMLDNFSLAQTRLAVAQAAGRIQLESSGGIDEKTITDIARTGVDYISIGVLTKTVAPLDLSMRFIP